jgi:hypothetical protein
MEVLAGKVRDITPKDVVAIIQSQSVCRLKEKEERPIEKQGRMAKLIF